MPDANKNEEVRNIVLIRGLMEQGGFYWCYVAVKPSLLVKFQQAVASKYNIQNFVKDGFGEVVVSGRGRMPPQHIIAELTEKLGVEFESLEDVSPEIAREKLSALASK
jgi:hypothetical protein